MSFFFFRGTADMRRAWEQTQAMAVRSLGTWDIHYSWRGGYFIFIKALSHKSACVFGIHLGAAHLSNRKCLALAVLILHEWDSYL